MFLDCRPHSVEFGNIKRIFFQTGYFSGEVNMVEGKVKEVRQVEVEEGKGKKRYVALLQNL